MNHNQGTAANSFSSSYVGRSVHGDHAVALQSSISQPGMCYLTNDVINSTMRAVQTRPELGAPFLIANVARTQRWMPHITHLKDGDGQYIGVNLIPVAMHGFVDCFVIDFVADCPRDERGVKNFNAYKNRLLTGELVVCAGRSDSWYELRHANDVHAPMVVMDSASFTVHSVREHDPTAKTMMLASDDNPIDVDVNERRDGGSIPFSPARPAVQKKFALLEMLVLTTKWQLVKPVNEKAVAEAIAADENATELAAIVAQEREADSLVNTNLERAIQLYSDSLDRRRRLGLDDAATIETAFKLGVALQKSNDLEAALRLFEEGYEKRKRMLGPVAELTLVARWRVVYALHLLKRENANDELRQLRDVVKDIDMSPRHSVYTAVRGLAEKVGVWS